MERTSSFCISERRPNIHQLLQLRQPGLRILHEQQVDLLRRWRGASGPDQQALFPQLLLAINAIAGGLGTTG